MMITNEQLARQLSVLFDAPWSTAFDTVDADTLAPANRVVLAGDGVAQCAALAANDLFERIEKEQGEAFAIRTETVGGAEFARYFDEHRRFWLEDKNAGLNRVNPLLCFVGVQGLQPEEALKKGMGYMSVPVALSDETESPFFTAAPHAVALHKADCPAAGYTQAAAALARIALAFHVAAGRMKEADAHKQWQGAAQHAAAFDEARIAALRAAAETLAADWKQKGVNWVDFVADGPAAGLAHLGRILFAKHDLLGDAMGCAQWDTARALCEARERTALFFYVEGSSPALSRTLETVGRAAAAGHPVAVVSDLPAERFPDGITVFTLPAASTRWSARILGCVPFALTANAL